MPAKTYDATRYSYQTEITRSNVSNLRLAWTFSSGVLRGHEAALLVGSTMYIVTRPPDLLAQSHNAAHIRPDRNCLP